MQKSEILIQVYSFTSAPIAKALVNAHKGVHWGIILDKSNKSKKYSAGDFTSHNGSNHLHRFPTLYRPRQDNNN
jgi:hypothetical protein